MNNLKDESQIHREKITEADENRNKKHYLTTLHAMRAYTPGLFLFQIGKLLRFVKVVAEKVDSCERCIRYAIITLLLLSTWPLVSNAQVEEQYNNLVSMNILIIVGYSSIMHVMFLLLNWIAAGFLGLSSPVKKTIVILGSHKALSFALKVLRFLTTNVGSRRLMSIVCVIAYLTLLVLDSMIVCKWATIKDDETEEDKSKQNGKYGTLPQDSD